MSECQRCKALQGELDRVRDTLKDFVNSNGQLSAMVVDKDDALDNANSRIAELEKKLSIRLCQECMHWEGYCHNVDKDCPHRYKEIADTGGD